MAVVVAARHRAAQRRVAVAVVAGRLFPVIFSRRHYRLLCRFLLHLAGQAGRVALLDLMGQSEGLRHSDRFWPPTVVVVGAEVHHPPLRQVAVAVVAQAEPVLFRLEHMLESEDCQAHQGPGASPVRGAGLVVMAQHL